MSAAYVIIALVALQRLAELPYAARNTKRLLASGGIEAGRGHYPLFIVLHAGWLIAIILGCRLIHQSVGPCLAPMYCSKSCGPGFL